MRKTEPGLRRTSVPDLTDQAAFLLNCLNLIYSLGLSGRSELVVDFSSTLMKYFRYLFKSSDSMVVLSEELKHVQNYLHIQQIRFQNDLDAAFNIDPQAEKCISPC